MPDLRNPVHFDRTYREQRGAMFAAANRVLRDPAAAEDVVQDVFMHLWRNPRSFDESRGSLSGYLTMLARSRALDRWRSRAARDAALERSAQQARLERPEQESAAEPVIRMDRSRRVVAALEELPGDQREAVLLAFGGGMSSREIAAAADVPVGTAKSRVRLGLMKARAQLEAAA